MAKNSPKRKFDLAIITSLILLFLFASPFTSWWSSTHLPWYMPYLFWLFVILLTALAHWRNPEP